MKFRVFESPEIEIPFALLSSQNVYEKLRPYAKADREIALILHLDSKNVIIEIETHTIGTLVSSAVYPREVFRSALAYNSRSIILAHNHPSGDCTPSSEDIKITKVLRQGGDIIGIGVLDHLIFSTTGYRSLADGGHLEN